MNTTLAPPASLTIIVPGCPSPELSSNTRAHWAKKAKAVSRARSDAKYATKWALDTGTLPIWCLGDVEVSAIIAWGYNRKQVDPTNLGHLLKSYVDGITDALECDDKRFVPDTITQCRAPKGDLAGWVEITLTPHIGAPE